jgi:hemerythrin-like metal-binding protein
MASGVLNCEVDVFRQHDKKLFNIFNDLENGMRVNDSTSDVAFEAITALFEYTLHDLVEEEQGMSATDYPGAQKHKKDHEYFKNTVNSYLSLMQFGSLPPAQEVRTFLAGWISTHIAGSQVLERR